MNSAVLIGDGDSGRAARIAEACSARGLTPRVVAHGPAALESSLQDVPDLIVASVDLPLIGAGKLADILRSNPRTQEVRFLFLGPAERSGAELSAFDEELPAEVEPDEVALLVEEMLSRQARIDAVAREAGADHELTGRLTQISLADLLQLFHLNRHSGTVEVVRREPGGVERRGRVFLRDGNVVEAQVGIVEGEKALFRLLSWRDGTFAFTPNRVQVASRITVPTRTLLMEGMRQLDEWDRVRSSLPPLDSQVSLTVKSADLPNVAQPLTQEVLLLLEIYSRVGDVIDHCSFPDYQVVRTLQTLLKRRIIELHHEPGQEESSPGEGLFTPAQARRLREWLLVGQPRSGPCHDGKLLLVSSDPAATEDWVRLLARLPGMRVHRDLREEPLGPTDLVSLGRLAVDEEIGIEILHLPARPEFGPVWPLAAHGALGSVLLLDGGDPAAAERIRAPAQVLSASPRGRTFHLLLLRGVRSAGPESIPDHLASLDERSLFVLPIESGKGAMEAVRRLLARVIP